MEDKKRKKIALGRGLDALLPGITSLSDPSQEYIQCDIDEIHPNRYQPRMRFSEEELRELADSIKTQGIVQPLLVRRDSAGYELVAGERRLRAARMAGLNQVPVIVKEYSDAQLLEISLIENIQRADLNPLEEAEAYHRLMTEFSLTQDQVAERVGKSRPAVANFIRLRQLSEPIKASLLEDTLSMGHARALLGADTPAQQNAAWREVMARGLSVRETEKLIRRLKEASQNPKKPPMDGLDRYFADLMDDLSRNLGTKVQIRRKGRKGKVVIEFYSDEDLDRLIGILRK